MKKILCLSAGIVSSLIISVIVVFAAISTNFEFQSFGIFFIVPLGSMVVGLGAAVGYALAAKLLNMKISAIDYLIALLLGLFSTFLVYFFFYNVSYVDDKNQIYYSLKPGFDTPVKNMETEDGNKMSFLRYTSMGIGERRITFSYKRRGALTTPKSPVIGWIDFSIELLGYLVGALAAIPLLVDTKFCDSCKIYFQKKKWLEADIDDQNALEAIDGALEKQLNLQQVLKNIPASTGKINMIFEGESCSKCGDGIFRVNFTKEKTDGDRDEIAEWKKEIAIRHNVPLDNGFSLQEWIQENKQAYEA